MSPALDGRRLILAGRALSGNRSNSYTFHFIYRNHSMSGFLSESMPLLAVFTCRPFEEDTIKFLGKASAGKLAEMYLIFLFKVIILQVLWK